MWYFRFFPHFGQLFNIFAASILHLFITPTGNSAAKYQLHIEFKITAPAVVLSKWRW